MRALVCVFLVACARLTPVRGEPDCSNRTFDVLPENDAIDVDSYPTVEVMFQSVDLTATIELEGPAGLVSGTLFWRTLSLPTLFFLPDAPLEPLTTYSVTVSFECMNQPLEWSFTTGDLGAPVDVSALAGRTYALPLRTARHLEGTAVTDLALGSSAGNALLAVTSAGEDGVELLGAPVADTDPPVDQDVCWPTWDFPLPAKLTNPYFEIGSGTMTLYFEGVAAPILVSSFGGTFTSDATEIVGLRIRGKMDTRPLVPLVGQDGPESVVCDMAATLGERCEECGAPNPGVFCVPVWMDQIRAIAIEEDLVEIPDQATACEAAECEGEPQCEAAE